MIDELSLGDYDFELESALTGENREQDYRRVCFVLSTPQGTLALDREFGIDSSYLGRPTETARALYAAECIEKVPKFVPTVRVQSVTWSADYNGNAKPKVVIVDG